MLLASCSSEILENISNFFNEVYLRREESDDGALWYARSTCSWMRQHFRPRPYSLNVYGMGGGSDGELIRLMKSFNMSSVEVLKICCLNRTVLAHTLESCPQVETLGIFFSDFQSQRYKEDTFLRLPRSLRHLFINELPTHRLASAVSQLPGLELFSWSNDMKLDEGFEGETVEDDLTDDDLRKMETSVDQPLATKLLVEFFGDWHLSERLYDLSFRKVTLRGLVSCPWVLTSLHHVKMSLDVLAKMGLENSLGTLLRRFKMKTLQFFYPNSDQGKEPVLEVKDGREVTVSLQHLDEKTHTSVVDGRYEIYIACQSFLLEMAIIVADLIVQDKIEHLKIILRMYSISVASGDPS